MKKMKKYFIGALAMGFCVATASGVLAVNASADNQQLSALTQDNYAVSFASIRYTTATDDNSGIRFSIRMDKSVYETVTAIEGVTLGAKLLPADLVTGALDVDTEGAQTAITYGVGADAENPTEVASTWGVASDDATKMEAIVYMYDIDTTSYNRDIAIVAYATVGEEEFYTTQVSEAVSEVAVKLLEADETAAEADKLTTEQKAELEGFLNDYQVNFYDVDGTTVLYSETHTYGEIVEVPTVEGAEILGWYAYDGASYATTATALGETVTVKGNMQYKVSEKASAMFDAVEHTSTAVKTDKVYGEQTYSTAVKSGAYQTTISFKLNDNAPSVPEGATHVTIYYLADTNVTNYANMYRLNAFGTEMTAYAKEWTAIKVSKPVYESYKANGTAFTMWDNSGASAGTWVYFSQPIFTTEDVALFENVSGTSTEVKTDKVYGDQSYSTAVKTGGYNTTVTFKISELAPVAPATATTVTIYYLADTSVTNYANLYRLNAFGTEITAYAKEWTAISVSKEVYEDYRSNGKEFSILDKSGASADKYVWFSQPVFTSALYSAVANTTVTEVTTAQTYTANSVTFNNFHDGQTRVFTATYNGDYAADNDSAAKFKVTSAALDSMPDEATTVKIAVRCSVFTYGGNQITDGTTTMTFKYDQWYYFTYTVDEFKTFIENGGTYSFGDYQGNGKSGVILISEPIFS